MEFFQADFVMIFALRQKVTPKSINLFLIRSGAAPLRGLPRAEKSRSFRACIDWRFPTLNARSEIPRNIFHNFSHIGD
ncbi:MAG: hypothetical protein WBG42_04490 [Cryomorphaceae bacterium]